MFHTWVSLGGGAARLTVDLAGLQVSGAALWRCARDVQLPCTTSRQLRDPYACQGKA